MHTYGVISLIDVSCIGTNKLTEINCDEYMPSCNNNNLKMNARDSQK